MDFYHYPPDIMNLLIETIPKLNKSKKDVLLFFKGVDIPSSIIQPIEVIVDTNRGSISKYQMVREVLEKINEQNDKYLRQRREIIKRICEFDTFDTCYESDRDRAKANVVEISKLVGIKDNITKYQQYVDSIRKERITAKNQELEKRQKLESKFENIKTRFNSLFTLSDPVKRGKALEPVLNDFFAFYGIGLSEAFTVTIDNDVVEQIDGAIILDGKAYLVEMKWEKEPIGVDKVGRFISRIFMRNDVGGIMISNSSYTEPAKTTANEALSQKSVTLVDLKDIYDIIDLKKDLLKFLRIQLTNSQINKKSYFKPTIDILDEVDFSKLVIH